MDGFSVQKHNSSVKRKEEMKHSGAQNGNKFKGNKNQSQASTEEQNLSNHESNQSRLERDTNQRPSIHYPQNNNHQSNNNYQNNHHQYQNNNNNHQYQNNNYQNNWKQNQYNKNKNKNFQFPNHAHYNQNNKPYFNKRQHHQNNNNNTHKSYNTATTQNNQNQNTSHNANTYETNSQHNHPQQTDQIVSSEVQFNAQKNKKRRQNRMNSLNNQFQENNNNDIEKNKFKDNNHTNNQQESEGFYEKNEKKRPYKKQRKQYQSDQQEPNTNNQKPKTKYQNNNNKKDRNSNNKKKGQRDQKEILDELQKVHVKEEQSLIDHHQKEFDENSESKLGKKSKESFPKKIQDTFRVVSWNVQWMDQLFEESEGGEIKFVISKEKNNLRKHIAEIIKEINCDIIGIQEGPSDIKKMKFFVKEMLKDAYHCFGGFDGAKQCTYFLVHKKSIVKDACIYEEAQQWLFKPWSFDIKGDLVLASYSYTRTPIVLKTSVVVKGEKKDLFAINIHTKSKHVVKGKEKWESNEEEHRIEYIKKSIEARRRIASECFRTRKCIDDIILAHFPEALIIVIALEFSSEDTFIKLLGDLNDGPGMDFFEEFYLLFDSAAALLGSPFHYKQLLYAVLFEEVSPDKAFSVEFYDFIDEIHKKKVLLDHIFVNSSLKSIIYSLGVAHEIYEAHYVGFDSYNNKLGASDHRPVYCDFSLK